MTPKGDRCSDLEILLRQLVILGRPEMKYFCITESISRASKAGGLELITEILSPCSRTKLLDSEGRGPKHPDSQKREI